MKWKSAKHMVDNQRVFVFVSSQLVANPLLTVHLAKLRFVALFSLYSPPIMSVPLARCEMLNVQPQK